MTVSAEMTDLEKQESIAKALASEEGRKSLARAMFLAASLSKGDFGTLIRMAKLDDEVDQAVREYWAEQGLDWDDKALKFWM